MPAARRSAAPPPSVEAFLATLDHPQAALIRALRDLILAVDPAVAEGIKWNAPSFRTGEWFATFHLRTTDGVQLILHRGAKARVDPLGSALPDPAGLLTWLGPDRASIKLKDAADLEAKRADLTALLGTWITRV